MAIQNDNKNKPSVEALISNAADFVDETVGVVAERIDVLPHLDGDTLTSAKQDLHRLVGKLREARHALFSPSEIFEKKGIDAIEECSIDTNNDGAICRLFVDAREKCSEVFEGYLRSLQPETPLSKSEIAQALDGVARVGKEYYFSANGREIGAESDDDSDPDRYDR